MMAENHQFHNPMTPTPIGIEEHIGMMHQMTSAFDGEHKIDVAVAEGEWIAVHGRWVGRHTGEFNGVPATGNEIEFTWNDFFHVVDGKVSAEHFEMNPMSIMAQIGAVPQE